MSTEEALKAFVETCDKDGVTLGECVDAYEALEKTVRNPVQQGCQADFRKAKTLEDKIRLLHSVVFIVRSSLFCKYSNATFLKEIYGEQINRERVLQEIVDFFKFQQVFLWLEESVKNETQEADSERGAENAQSVKRTTPQQNPRSRRS